MIIPSLNPLKPDTEKGRNKKNQDVLKETTATFLAQDARRTNFV